MQAWEIETRKGVSLFVGIPYIPTFRYTHCVVEDSWRNAWQPPNTIWRKNFSFGVATAREQLAEEFWLRVILIFCILIVILFYGKILLHVCSN